MTANRRGVKPVAKATPERGRLPAELSPVNLSPVNRNAAGIDVGASSRFVAVSPNRAAAALRLAANAPLNAPAAA